MFYFERRHQTFDLHPDVLISLCLLWLPYFLFTVKPTRLYTSCRCSAALSVGPVLIGLWLRSDGPQLFPVKRTAKGVQR